MATIKQYAEKLQVSEADALVQAIEQTGSVTGAAALIGVYPNAVITALVKHRMRVEVRRVAVVVRENQQS